MKFAILALTVLGLAAVVEMDVTTRKAPLGDMRIRLGHFREEPFTDLYHHYAAVFVRPDSVKRAADDYRNYMPSAEECEKFFWGYRQNKNVIKDLDEFVVLDACLGYLFDKEDHPLDTESSEEVKHNLRKHVQEADLKQLYDSKINEFDEGSKRCFVNLMLQDILGKNQFKNVQCNNHFLQVYLQFAECEKANRVRSKYGDDSYVKQIIEIVANRVNNCFEVEIHHINNAIRKSFARSRVNRGLIMVKSIAGNTLAKQQKELMWPKQIVRLLAAVQNTTNEINTRYLHKILRGIYQGNEHLKETFLRNLADFAQRSLNPKSDKEAQLRYQKLMDDVCAFFRSSDDENQYDFATPIIRMVQLLQHTDLFPEINDQKFIESILTKETKETRPTYLALSFCNILPYTEGRLPVDKTNMTYVVDFKSDVSNMVIWPDAGYY